MKAVQRAVAEVSRDPDWLGSLGPVGVALKAWRDEIAEALGGIEGLTPQQRIVLDTACKSYLILSTIDDWILRQASPIKKRSRSLLPVVRERQQIADSLLRQLNTLGLERKDKRVRDLALAIKENQD